MEATGAAGIAVRIVKATSLLSPLVPMLFVAVASKLYVWPDWPVKFVIAKLPLESAVAVPSAPVPPTAYKSTVAPAVVVPMNSGVRLFVYPGVVVTKLNVGAVGAVGVVGDEIPGTLSVNEYVILITHPPPRRQSCRSQVPSDRSM